MQSDITLTEDDEGKRVSNANGDEIGRVVEVKHGTAYVEPDPGLTDTLLAKLGWAESDEDSYRLDPDRVESVTDNEIRLKNH